MSKLALITGITGQDGSYLAELLLNKSYKVYGIVRRTSGVFNSQKIAHIKNNLELFYGDLSDTLSIHNIINNIIKNNKDYIVLEIYNLAAQSHVKVSFENPEYTTLIDALGTLKLLEIIKNDDENLKKIKFYQAGTSEMYGDVLQIPQNENTPFNPQSPYACAKVYSHFIVKNYRDAYNIFACNGILFNHESSRRGENFVTKKIVNGVKKIRTNLDKNGDNDFILELGNLDAKRDWGHAKDYVYGMWLMLQQNEADDYVLATNNTTSVRSFVEKCFLKVNIKICWEGEKENEIGYDLKTNETLVKINAKYFRPCEVNYLLGDPRKAIEKLNWKQEYDNLDKIIDSMFNEV